MSFKKNDKEKIKTYILEQISKKNIDFVRKTMETFSVSRTSVYNYLKALKAEDILVEKQENGKTKYELKEENYYFVYYTKDKLEEDVIFDRDIKPLIAALPKNVFDIWRYAFTEMMNNAIEHSEASFVISKIIKNKLSTTIGIADDGIGIFKKIRDYLIKTQSKDITLDDAVAELFAGKFTTASSNHSGEGIFFTSRAMDSFAINSDNKIFSHDSFKDKYEDYVNNKGTLVVMSLSNTSPKKITDVFNMYTDEDKGFFKTQIPIAHMFANGYPVSRSEARRLASVLERFEEVILDFANVENVGQAFVHELFEVFQKNNPKIKIDLVNMNTDVEKMVKRVTAKS